MCGNFHTVSPRDEEICQKRRLPATLARQLTQAAGRAKDSGRRCDIEAGMGKLLGARILNIFEGAAEIQTQMIARGLLSGRN